MIQKLKLPMNGLNVFADPTQIQDGQWQRLKNLAPVSPGIVGTRPSLSFQRELTPHWLWWDSRVLTGMGLYSAVEGYWKWARTLRPIRFIFDQNFGEVTMIAVTTEATQIQRQDAPNVSVNWTAPEGTMLLITLPGFMVGNGSEPVLRAAVLGEATRCPSLFKFNGITYAFAGQNAGRKVVPESDVTLPIAFGYDQVDFGTNNGAFQPDGAFVLRNRVVYYKGNYIWFSDVDAPEVISADDSSYEAMDIFVGGTDEMEDITAGAEVNTTAEGSPNQSVGMIFTRNSAYMLVGEPVTPGSVGEGGDVYGSLQINRLNIKAGCVSQATIKRTPYGTFWVGADDVWFMPYGSLPIRVGTSIRPLLEAQPQQLAWKIHAEYANGFYRISLFADGQGPNAFSPCGMQLWLDLTQGAPRNAEEARWFGPQVFVNTDGVNNDGTITSAPAGVFCMAVDDRTGGDGRLYALQTYAMRQRNSSSTVINGMSLCSFDGLTGHDTTAPQSEFYEWQPDTAYDEGTRIQVWVPGTGSQWVPAVFICTAAGTSNPTPPDFATGLDANGQVIEFLSTLQWTALYFDGTNALSGYTPQAYQYGNEVCWNALSKEMFLGDEMVEKLLDGAELGYYATAPAYLTYNSHPKQDSVSRILTPDNDQIADNVLGSWTGDRVWQRKLLTPSPSKRFRALSAMWECSQTAGIIITEGVNDTLRVTEGATTTTVNIAPGYYATISAVISALNAALAVLEIDLAAVYVTRVAFENAGVTNLTLHYDDKLMQLLGFDTYTATSEEITAGGGLLYAVQSPYWAKAAPMQISGINLRARLFGRRPT